MQADKKRDTAPELAIRRRLHSAGARYRVNLLIRLHRLNVRPDIVFRRAKLAVFIDGCFWHGCPEHGVVPKTNLQYWGPKLERNRSRDERVSRALVDDGWEVLRIWEHEAPEMAVERILVALRSARDRAASARSARER